MKWVEQTKTYTDKGYNNKSSLWSDVWTADQGPDGKVFGFFYSTWGINFTLLGNSLETPEAEGGKAEVDNGIYGDYAVCEPAALLLGRHLDLRSSRHRQHSPPWPISCAATCDQAIMKQITVDTQDYTNNSAAMEACLNSDFKSDFLGGQNHIALFAAAAPNIGPGATPAPTPGPERRAFRAPSKITSTAWWIWSRPGEIFQDLPSRKNTPSSPKWCGPHKSTTPYGFNAQGGPPPPAPPPF